MHHNKHHEDSQIQQATWQSEIPEEPKKAYRGDKFLHIGAVAIVNNTDHTLHYATEE